MAATASDSPFRKPRLVGRPIASFKSRSGFFALIAVSPFLQLLLQVLIEPVNCQLDRLIALLTIDSVVSYPRYHDIFLVGSRHPVIGKLRVLLVVEQFLFFRHDEQHRAVLDLWSVFHGSE